MRPAAIGLGLLLLLGITFAADESCVGRCDTFDPRSKCQCDAMCTYYRSCCADFHTTCPKKTARGDTFAGTEEVSENATAAGEVGTTLPPTANAVTVPQTPNKDTPTADPNAATCSARPFDAFLQLKDGSTYAFRGEYLFKLDAKAVLPGYPKLIQDVWGIPGPIDAAFTRINCQGKTYIFKGNQYWRIDDHVVEEGYPKNISAGFDGIPDNVDAVFAIPAPSHRGKEKAYFFKGEKYYQYQFVRQPSHEECVSMSRSSPSALFTRYTDLFCDQTWEDFFTELFGGSVGRLPGPTGGPRYISQDWVGISPPVDAAMVGRVYVSPRPTQAPPLLIPRGRRRGGRRRGQRRRHRRHLFDLWNDYWYDYSDDGQDAVEADQAAAETREIKATPVQNVYFFKRDKYYRVDLQTKHVSPAWPPYPRSIAKYWLGCAGDEAPGATPNAEK